MKTTLFLSVCVALFCLTLTECQQPAGPKNEPPKEEALSQEDLVKRGEYLVSVLACDDCHSPKVMTAAGPVVDTMRRLSGHPSSEPFPVDDKKKMIAEQHIAVFSAGLTAIAGPWGVSYTANLTPDDTGIGVWTEAQFFKAIREGKSKGLDNTRPLLPPMPWMFYKNMTDEDLRAVFNYLKTLKPVNNVVPNPVMWQ